MNNEEPNRNGNELTSQISNMLWTTYDAAKRVSHRLIETVQDPEFGDNVKEKIGTGVDKVRETVNTVRNSEQVGRIKEGTINAFTRVKETVTDKEKRDETIGSMKQSVVGAYETVRSPEFRQSIIKTTKQGLGLEEEPAEDNPVQENRKEEFVAEGEVQAEVVVSDDEFDIAEKKDEKEEGIQTNLAYKRLNDSDDEDDETPRFLL